MIQTKFYTGQGLGNQLWVYAASRGIAERLGREHVVSGYEAFKGHDVVDLDWGDPDLLLEGPVARFQEELFYDSELNYFASDFDYRVLDVPGRCQIDGLMQSEKYFFGREVQLSQWIRITPSVGGLAEEFSDRVVLNLRGGEYKRHKHLVLPKSYWVDAMRHLTENTGEDRFLVVTDDPAYARALFPNFDVVSGIANSWAALHTARALAVSNSSFSYFPIKTRSDNPLVIAPALWARPSNQFDRWASPANFYRGWQWLGMDGEILDSAQCSEIIEATQKYYQSYCVRVSKRFAQKQSFSSHIPGWVKRSAKLILSRIIPTKIG